MISFLLTIIASAAALIVVFAVMRGLSLLDRELDKLEGDDGKTN